MPCGRAGPRSSVYNQPLPGGCRCILMLRTNGEFVLTNRCNKVNRQSGCHADCNHCHIHPMTPQEMSRPNKGYTKHERLAKMRSMTASDLEQQSQRQQISREKAAMQREIHGLQRPGRLVDCGDGKLASVSVMTLPRNITRGQQCAIWQSFSCSCRRTQLFWSPAMTSRPPRTTQRTQRRDAKLSSTAFAGSCCRRYCITATIGTPSGTSFSKTTAKSPFKKALFLTCSEIRRSRSYFLGYFGGSSNKTRHKGPPFYGTQMWAVRQDYLKILHEDMKWRQVRSDIDMYLMFKAPVQRKICYSSTSLAGQGGHVSDCNVAGAHKATWTVPMVNIHDVEELPLQPVCRESMWKGYVGRECNRLVCIRMGNATYTPNPKDVDHEKGIYLLLPQDELTSFLRHPVTAALYLREWCLPFFQENSVADCLNMLHDLKCIDDRLDMDTQWLAAKLSGRDLVPPGNDRLFLNANDEMVELVHAATPQKTHHQGVLVAQDRRASRMYILKPRSYHKAPDLRWCSRSFFAEALQAAGPHSFEKLQINWAKLKQSMNRCGGFESFGNWTEWTCPFDLKFVMQSWDGNAFRDYTAFYRQHCTARGNTDAFLRPVADTVQESVELEKLRLYAAQGNDRRQELLEAYIHRHDTMGCLDADGQSVIEVEYYTQPSYGRLLARGIAGQKLTK